MSEQKRFENWEEVSCNDCACYWDNSCDGVIPPSQKLCNSFKATRKIVIPAQIKALEKRVKWLECATGIGFTTIGILILMRLF